MLTGRPRCLDLRSLRFSYKLLLVVAVEVEVFSSAATLGKTLEGGMGSASDGGNPLKASAFAAPSSLGKAGLDWFSLFSSLRLWLGGPCVVLTGRPRCLELLKLLRFSYKLPLVAEVFSAAAILCSTSAPAEGSRGSSNRVSFGEAAASAGVQLLTSSALFSFKTTAALARSEHKTQACLFQL